MTILPLFQQNLMQKPQLFKLSNQELRKINNILPKGYKLITKQENGKKKSIPIPPKKKTQLQLLKSKSQLAKQKLYHPYHKVVVDTKIEPDISIKIEEDSPDLIFSSVTKKLFHRLKKHSAINLLNIVEKDNLMQCPSFKEVEMKIAEYSDYSVQQFESDIRKMCLSIYQKFLKNDQEYKDAANIENYLTKLIKLQKISQPKKIEEKPFQLQLLRESSATSLPAYKTKKSSKIDPLLQTSTHPATLNEKKMLGYMIKKLPSQNLQQVCYIVAETLENKEYCFDICTLHEKKFKELQDYVKKCTEKTGEWDRVDDSDELSGESQFVIEDDD